MAKYQQSSNTSCTLVGNKLVDHLEHCLSGRRRCSNYIFILDLTPGFNELVRQLQDQTTIILVLGIGAAYIRGFVVPEIK